MKNGQYWARGDSLNISVKKINFDLKGSAETMNRPFDVLHIREGVQGSRDDKDITIVKRVANLNLVYKAFIFDDSFLIWCWKKKFVQIDADLPLILLKSFL